MPYWLPHHIRLCLHEGGAVWLDMRRDKYIGQGRAELHGLSTVVVGWPVDAHDSDVSPQEATYVAEQLAAAGLLTQDPTGRSAAPLRVKTASSTFNADDEYEVPARIRALIRWRFLRSRITSRRALRSRSFEYALERARRRKADLRDKWTPADMERARMLLSQFNRWQLLIFSLKDKCLEDSLWRAEFLTLNDLGFRLIIGIHKHTLAYHCWIQAGDWILTGDEPVMLQAYLPILEL